MPVILPVPSPCIVGTILLPVGSRGVASGGAEGQTAPPGKFLGKFFGNAATDSVNFGGNLGEMLEIWLK